MSWGAFGNALIGGHQAFRMAVADQEERARRAELDRRYQEEQAYRASRDTVEDARAAELLTLQQARDTRDAEAQRYDRTTNQLDRLRESRGVVDPTLKAAAGEFGLGGEIASTAPLTGFAATANSIAGGGLEPSLGNDYVRQTPAQLAQEESTRLALAEKQRLANYYAEIAAVNPNSPTANQQWYAIAQKYAVAEAQDPELRQLEINRIKAVTNASNANAAESISRGKYYADGGAGGARPPKPTMGSAISSDPAFAQLVDTYYRDMGGLIDNALGLYGKGAVLGGKFDMASFFGQAQAGQDEALKVALAKAAKDYQAQGKPLPPDVAPRVAALTAPAAGAAPANRTYRAKLQNGAPVAGAPPPTNNPY